MKFKSILRSLLLFNSFELKWTRTYDRTPCNFATERQKVRTLQLRLVFSSVLMQINLKTSSAYGPNVVCSVVVSSYTHTKKTFGELFSRATSHCNRKKKFLIPWILGQEHVSVLVHVFIGT